MKQPFTYEGYGSAYNAKILNYFNLELQLRDTESAIRNKLKDLVKEFKGFKFVKTLVLEFKKIEVDDETKYGIFSLSSKAETVINESDINDVFESIYSGTISNIQISVRKNSVFIINSVLDHTINISKYKPLSVYSYMTLPKELDHPKNVSSIFKI